MTQTISLLFGRTGLELTLPASATVLAGAHAPAIPNPELAIRQALQSPYGTPPLAALLQQRQPRTAAITISDITRPVPNQLLLPPLLETLNAHGVPDSHITIIIGTGMHRPSTPAEHLELVGPDILQRCRVVDHRAEDPSTLTRIAQDPPVSINTLFAQADFRIVTGLIEPHFMAGFSGGRKGVCPALVDLQTLQRFHGHAILHDPRSTNGELTDNPCHAESLRIARLVGVDFLCNVAINRQRQLCGIYAGDMEQAHLAGTQEVARFTSAFIEKPFDLIVTCGGGYPLDQTFYQSVKGMVTALPACHAQSVLLMASHCGEGVGSESYTQMMLAFSNRWQEFLTHIAATPTVRKDQWQGQMQCRALERFGPENLWFACDELPLEMLNKLWVTPLASPPSGTAQQRVQHAIDQFISQHPHARVAVIPEGPYTLLRYTHE